MKRCSGQNVQRTARNPQTSDGQIAVIICCVMQAAHSVAGRNLLSSRGVIFAYPVYQAFRPSKAPPRLHGHVLKATEEDEGSRGGLDWDSAWSNFKEGLNKNIPVVEDRTAKRSDTQQQQQRSNSKSPQFARDSRRQLRENIKKQENLVLDFWSQELFFKAGGVFIAVLLVIFLLIGGPGGPE